MQGRIRGERRPRRGGEGGQALVLFAGGLVIFLGLVAMSIDVGRLVWARTQMQAAVDASALAGAQSMPNLTDAQAKANEYWADNARFIIEQGQNVSFTAESPAGSNKGILVRGSADVPTWFARFFGIDAWHVEASATAESQVLDISIVLDISGSMCFDSYPRPETDGYIYLGPGRTGSIPTLRAPILVGGPSTITIQVSSAAPFAAPARNYFGSSAGNTAYNRYAPSGGRAGLIMIGPEIFQISSTGVDTVRNELTVTRGIQNRATPAYYTPKVAHATGDEIWMQRGTCAASGRTNDGPFEPYDSMVDDAEFFVSLFNERYDKIGLASFSSDATLVHALTPTFSSVTSAMNSMADPYGTTNIAYGLATGRRILDGGGKRSNAIRVMVFLTDGRANTWCTNGYENPTCNDQYGGDTSTTARSHARQQAETAAAGGIIVYTIGLGNDVDDALLQYVADVSKGAYYKAPTVAQLDDAFKAIAEQTHIALTQ